MLVAVTAALDGMAHERTHERTYTYTHTHLPTHTYTCTTAVTNGTAPLGQHGRPEARANGRTRREGRGGHVDNGPDHCVDEQPEEFHPTCLRRRTKEMINPAHFTYISSL